MRPTALGSLLLSSLLLACGACRPAEGPNPTMGVAPSGTTPLPGALQGPVQDPYPPGTPSAQPIQPIQNPGTDPEGDDSWKRNVTPEAAIPTMKLVLGSGDVLAQGEIHREISRTADNDPFIAGTGASLHMEIRQHMMEDAPAPLLAEGSAAIRPGLLVFPISYELRGNAAQLRKQMPSFLVSATLDAAKPRESGMELMSEYQNVLPSVGAKLDILVSGLESCKSPHAGGFCRD